MLFITHDLGVVGEIAESVVVMQEGEIQEQGSVDAIFEHPQHPYTKALLACRPRLDRRPRRLPVIDDFIKGGGRLHLEERHRGTRPDDAIILEVQNLDKTFFLKEGLFGKRAVPAVKDVSFRLPKGKTLGLVGESGSGKTTVGLTLMRLHEATGGKVLFEGTDLLALSEKQMMAYRRRIQIIFQNPYASLNPRFTVGQILVEPMKIHSIGSDQRERVEMAFQMLKRVGLSEASFYKYPHEFSGGQRQRIAIARCLTMKPDVLICDESVSALDVSVQAQVLNLLQDLQDEFGLSYIFISPRPRGGEVHLRPGDGDERGRDRRDRRFRRDLPAPAAGVHPQAPFLDPARAREGPRSRLAEVAAMRTLTALLAAAAIVPVFAAGAPQHPHMPVYDAPGLAKACADGLANAKRAIAAMDARRGAGTILDEWNRTEIAIEDVVNPVYLLGSVSPDKAVRDASEPCLQQFTTLNTEIFQDEKLYRRVLAVKPADGHQAKLKKDLIEGFEDSGVTLPADKRARAKAIFDKLEELRQAYDRNVRDDPTTVTFTAAEMQGLPESYLKAHQQEQDGSYVMRLDYPSYSPFMANAKSGAARQRYYVAKLREGGEANLALLGDIFKLRQELAGLYGQPSFAAYSLRRKMAGTPEAVEKFLAEVHDKVQGPEKRELEELRTEKAKELGTPLAATKLERWDVTYYEEKVKRARYAIDQEKLRKYFPTGKSVDYMLLVAQKLYGVKFREAKAPVWSPDVRYFDVLDAKTGRYLSGFYLDLYPRESKYGDAATFPIRGASSRVGRTPLAALVANFNREGLDHDELETLMHEFGHVLHNVLSRTEYEPDAGTAVKIDFVEAPSQMFEEWARREQPLELFRQVCPDCPHLTHEQIERLEAARRYGQGIFYARQWLYASFDMALSLDPRPPLEVWKKLESATPLGTVEGTMFPSGFTHISSNYAAGYYGYMWSQVLALDMLTPFKKDMLDPRVGKRYLDTILSQGGQREEKDMVRDFLGREPSSEAFFAEITGKR